MVGSKEEPTLIMNGLKQREDICLTVCLHKQENPALAITQRPTGGLIRRSEGKADSKYLTDRVD